MNMKTKNYLLLTTSLAAAAFIAGPASAQSVWTGESSYWVSPGTAACPGPDSCPVYGNSNWNTGMNWDGGVPDLSTDVFIGSITSGSRPENHDTVTITEGTSGTDAWARSISIGFAGNRSSEGATGPGALSVWGDLVVDQNINVGVTGTGTYDNYDTTTITNGNFVVGSQFATGTATNHAGAVLTLENGTVVVANGDFDNEGTTEIRNGNFVVGSQFATGTATNHAGAVLTLEKGSVVVANGVFDNDGELQIEEGSLIIGEDGASTFLGDANSTLGPIGRDLVVGKSADGTMISDTDITVRNNTTIGVDSGVLGELTLRNGANLNTTGTLTVGDSGDATFTIGTENDASTVTTGDKVVIGDEQGSDGVVKIVNGSMDNGTTLTIGNEGNGQLNVAAGNTVTTNEVVKLGVESGSLGIVLNSGSVENDRGLIIGDKGTGAFYTQGQNASTTTNGDVTLGQERGGLGLVVVDDGGSMDSNARFDVGHEGEGYLLVTDGGSVSNGAGTIARREGSSGFAVVTDAGVWENESLTVGEANDTLGVLVINDGGRVSVGGGDGRLVIAAQEGSEGILNIGAYSHDVDDGYGFHPAVEGLLNGENYNDDARAAGFLDAQYVEFGEGNGTVNFKTTSNWFNQYDFDAGFVGDGTVNHYAGFTVLNGDSSGFAGSVNVEDGVLVANGDLSGKVIVGTDGTLGIGHGGTSGDVFNDITNNGRVFFNRSDDYVFDSVIEGTGDVVQIGSGTTIITADQDYKGQTRIWNGTLQLGNGGTVGSIDETTGVHVGRWGTLAFNRSDDVGFDLEITGTGAIDHIGPGATVLTADNSAFTGHTTIDAGLLAVTDVLGGTVEINDTGTLAGTGWVGTTVAHDGGTIAPGLRSIDELSIDGDLTQEAGSTYQVEVLSTGETDLIFVDGVATLDDGAVLNVTKLDDDRYDLERRYTVLTAGVEVTGTYDLTGDTFVSAFYRVEDQYDDNNVYLKVNQHRQFQEAALTSNQLAAAGAAQELRAQLEDIPGYETTGRPTNELFRAIAYLPTDELAQFAFDQISGEIYASTTIGLIEQSRFVRDATGQRIRDAFGGVGAATDVEINDGLSLWMDGFGSWSEIDGDGNAGTFSHNTGGFFLGADVPVTDLFRVGVLGGYSRSSFGSEGRGSSVTSDNFDLGIYAGGEIENFGFRLGANHTWHNLEANRNVNIPGFSDSLSSEFDARTTQVYGDIGYTVDLGGVSFEPFAGLAYVSVDRGGYGEDGGAAVLSGGSDVVDATFATLGLRGSAVITAGEVPVKATGMIGWRHALEELTPTATHSFAGSSPFTVSGIPLAQDVAVVEAGLETTLTDELTLGVSYSGQFGSGISDHGVRGNLNWNF